MELIRVGYHTKEDDREVKFIVIGNPKDEEGINSDMDKYLKIIFGIHLSELSKGNTEHQIGSIFHNVDKNLGIYEFNKSFGTDIIKMFDNEFYYKTSPYEMGNTVEELLKE